MTQVVRVGDIAVQVRGVTYQKQDAVVDRREGYVPLLRAGNITDSGLDLGDLLYVPPGKVSERQVLQQGDVLIAASSGSLEVVGKAAKVNDPGHFTFGAFCKVLRPSSKVDPNYFAQFFKTPAYRRTVSALAAGANINNLRNGDLDNLEIPLPPIDEQRRIAAILDKADELRSKRRAALETLETLSQAIFIEMFGDPTLPSYPLRDSEGKCVPMGIVSEIQTGKLDANAAVEGGEFPFFTCSRQTLTIDKAAFHGRAVLVAGNGDLNVKYYEGHFNAYQRTYVIKSSDERVVHPRFLHGFLDLYVAKLRQQAIGGVIQYIKLPYLKDALIRIPPWSQQEEFLSRIEGANSGIVSLRTSTTQINQLFASLQQKAFQGTL